MDGWRTIELKLIFCWAYDNEQFDLEEQRRQQQEKWEWEEEYHRRRRDPYWKNDSDYDGFQ